MQSESGFLSCMHSAYVWATHSRTEGSFSFLSCQARKRRLPVHQARRSVERVVQGRW